MSSAQDAPYSGLAQGKEVIESIVIAFILAFTFISFVAQAFEIPTGSMAEPLRGKHRDHVCASCGYHYAVAAALRPVQQLVCPNCNWFEPLEGGGGVDGGDGILVL